LNYLQKLKYRIIESSFKKNTPKETFTKIYNSNFWRSKSSVSGPGSEDSQTNSIIEALRLLIYKYKIKSILDLPCGDFIWMKNIDLGSINYLGADIVDRLIQENLKNHTNEPNISFSVLDLITDNLPKSDLILNRDCLVHFSYKDIYSSIKNIKASDSTYLLTTTFPNHTRNTDIITGKWRPLNLQIKPFNFPEPIVIITENCTEENDKYRDKSLSLWKTIDIKLPIKNYEKI